MEGFYYVVFGSGGGGGGVVAEGLGEGGGVPFGAWEVSEHAEGTYAGESVMFGVVDDYVVVLLE